MSLSEGHVDTLAISPNNKFIASGGSENKILIHDIASGLPVATFTGHRKRVKGLAFSPDNLTLVSSSEDHSLRLWHLPTKRELGVLDTTSRPYYLGFSNDSRQLIAGGTHPEMKQVWFYPGK